MGVADTAPPAAPPVALPAASGTSEGPWEGAVASAEDAAPMLVGTEGVV